MVGSERAPLAVNFSQDRNLRQSAGNVAQVSTKPQQSATVKSPSGRSFSFKSKNKPSTGNLLPLLTKSKSLKG